MGKDGGAEAAHLLHTEIERHLKITYPESNVSDWSKSCPIQLAIFCLEESGITIPGSSQVGCLITLGNHIRVRRSPLAPVSKYNRFTIVEHTEGHLLIYLIHRYCCSSIS